MEETITLSEREQEILRLVATGASNKEIAQQLSISPNTVKVHVRNIFAKIGVSSRTEATLYAIREGLVAAPGGEAAVALENAVEHSPETELPHPRRGSLIFLGLVGLIFIGLLGFSLGQHFFPSRISTPEPTVQARWEVLQSLPVAQNAPAFVGFENQIYAIGGENSNGVSGTTEVYSPAQNTWKTLAEKPSPVADASAGVLRGKIFIPGGRLNSGQLSDGVEAYDPRSDHWEKLTNLPIKVSGYAMTSLEGRLFLFGGWDGRAALASVYEYSPDEDHWIRRADMPTARAFAGAVSVGGKIYVVGGTDGTQALAVCEVYSPDMDNGKDRPWDTAASLPKPRSHPAVASLLDTIYLLGDHDTPVALAYSPGDNSWGEAVNIPTLSAPVVRVVALNDSLYIQGGNQAPSTENQFLAYKVIYTIAIPGVTK